MNSVFEMNHNKHVLPERDCWANPQRKHWTAAEKPEQVNDYRGLEERDHFCTRLYFCSAAWNMHLFVSIWSDVL